MQMIKKTNELQKQYATQNTIESNSWWAKYKPVLKTCHTILQHVLNIIKIIDLIYHLIP